MKKLIIGAFCTSFAAAIIIGAIFLPSLAPAVKFSSVPLLAGLILLVSYSRRDRRVTN